MRKERFAALAFSAILVFGVSAPALAEDSGPVNVVPILISQQDTEPLPESSLYCGTISGIYRNERGEITSIQMTSQSKGEMIFHISADTLYVDAGDHSAGDASLLKEGTGLYVFHSAAMTMSLPPQTSAIVVVGNVPMDAGCPMYHEIEDVETRDGTTVVKTGGGGIEMYLNSETEVTAYTKEGSKELQPGGHVMAWYTMVLESLPAQVYPTHVMVLPEVEVQAPEIILVNGERLESTYRLQSGVYMVPLRAVAEALGLEVGYEKENGVQTITITGEATSASVTAGSVEAKCGGESVVLDTETYVEKPGTTWVSAELFSLVGITVEETGEGLSFTR